jgi:polyisoprenoid-binding protein YceI
MKNALFYLLLFVSFQISAQDWRPTTYTVKFKLKMMGLGVNGSFKGLKPKIVFNANGDLQSIQATVDANTVDTDNNLRDTHLKEKSDFFEVAKYPTISMSSTQILKNTDGTYTGTFVIVLKNISKTVKVPVIFDKQTETATLKSTFSITRSLFNFGGNTPGMGDKVDINLSLNFKKN